jgi:uncharacterized protein (DUF427 family)
VAASWWEDDNMVRAVWNGQILAESDATVVVEGNHYFPPASVRIDLFRESSRLTHCPWKGDASYLSIVVDGRVNPDAGWYYPNPTPEAAHIKDHVAFWHGVEIDGVEAMGSPTLRQPDWSKLGETGS